MVFSVLSGKCLWFCHVAAASSLLRLHFFSLLTSPFRQGALLCCRHRRRVVTSAHNTSTCRGQCSASPSHRLPTIHSLTVVLHNPVTGEIKGALLLRGCVQLSSLTHIPSARQPCAVALLTKLTLPTTGCCCFYCFRTLWIEQEFYLAVLFCFVLFWSV